MEERECKKRGKMVMEEEGCSSDFIGASALQHSPKVCARQELLLNRQVGGKSIWGNANRIKQVPGVKQTVRI